MTPRLLTLLSILTAPILFTAALTAPVSVEGAALPAVPAAAAAKTTKTSAPGSVDVRLGDGIFRLRVRTCDGCAPVLALEIAIPKVRINWTASR